MNLELQRQHAAHKARQASKQAAAIGYRQRIARQVAREYAGISEKAAPRPRNPVAEMILSGAGPRLRAVIKATAQHFQVEPDDVVDRSRKAKPVRWRAVAKIVAHERYDFSLPQLGRRFGGYDHTTVLHALKKREQFADDVAAVHAIMDQSRDQ